MNLFRNLFKEAGVKDVITLFHAPSSPASIRAHTILKQAAANAQETATIDQAGDHSKQSKTHRTDFNIDVQEEPPTSDQLSSILEYLNPSQVGEVVEGATESGEALKKFGASQTAFRRPVIVDWNHGRAVVGDNESEILKLIRSLPEKGEKA